MTDHEPSHLLADEVRRGWALLQSQRPHAAWAAWQSVLRQSPDESAASKALKQLASAPDLPEVARRPLRFAAPATQQARESWNKAFGKKPLEDLADPAGAALVFRHIVENHPGDAPAAWNFAACLAWAGSNWLAIEALDDFIELSAEADPDRAADAACLAELLRLGAGCEEIADALNQTISFSTDSILIEPHAILSAYGHVQESPREIRPDSSLLGDLLAARPNQPWPNPVLASVVANARQIRLSQPSAAINHDFLETISAHFEVLTGTTPDIHSNILSVSLADAALTRFRIRQDLSNERKDTLTLAAVSSYFEETWINLPKMALAGMTPLEYAQSLTPVKRARLEGLIAFQQQYAARPVARKLYQNYDFDRLRYRLGLLQAIGSIDAKGEARHNSLLWFHLDYVRRQTPGKISDNHLITAWETATACRDNTLAVTLGKELLARDNSLFADISLARWVAPFLRRALAEDDLESARSSLTKAIELDLNMRGGHERVVLHKWRAEVESRLGDTDSATRAWSDACQLPDAPPITRFEAVLDLAEADPLVAGKFCREMQETTENSYVRALLAHWLEMQE